jgi:acyl-CoA thioesterase-1
MCGFVAAASSRSFGTPISEQRKSGTPSSSSNATAHEKVIVTFGDSLTQGVAGRSYPDYLQDLLTQNGYPYRIDNQGVGGDTTSDGLARIDNVIAVHPALVILEFGGNDGLRGLPLESIRKHLEEMIIRLKQANIPVALAGITLPPNYGPDYVGPFTAMFPELAKKYHLRLLPFLLIHVYQHPEMMQSDGVHPNGTGNKVLAQDIFALIQPMLTRDHSNKKVGMLWRVVSNRSHV